jgi:hypothetical protein
MVEDRRADSVRHAQEKKAFKSTIKRLESKLAGINYTTASVPELDSIRRVIYGDSISFSDTLYAMPIDQARDVMEAKAGEYLKDSLISEYATRVDSLERQSQASEEKFKAEILVNHDIRARQSEIEKHLEAVGDEYKREIRKQKRMRWIDRIVGGAVGFGIGRIKK